jgi:sugar (pentulose or hexulose) kinase
MEIVALPVCLRNVLLLHWKCCRLCEYRYSYSRTSGARISVIEPVETTNKKKNDYQEVYTQSLVWDGKGGIGTYDDASAWMTAVETLLAGASKDLGGLESIQSICVSGTSASCLLVDRQTQQVTRSPRMYNYDILVGADENPTQEAAAREALALLERHAPPRHTARARTGSLAKLLAWAKETPLTKDEVLCHQSDYISMRLLSQTTPVKSDWHNCLKLGFDVRQREWPEWLVACLKDAGVSNPVGEGLGVIPLQIVSPGEPMGTIDRGTAERVGLSPDTIVVGGTTDSNAAFFAAAGTTPSYGTAVTSLGSTLAMKQLSPTYVEDADRGVYSHRFPNFENPEEEAWLVGGASNVGCVILRELEFSTEELTELSQQIDPMQDSPLTYYPLTKVGERFPVADPDKKPVLKPVPESRKEYLHGLLQSIGDVEREGFSVLQDLGAPPPTIIWTCGGGSKNEMWSRLRERRLSERFDASDIKVRKADCTEASYGAALLAAANFH